MKIFKFGGASVKNADAVRNLSKILNGYKDNLIVVISAMGKTTDLLETLVKSYFAGNEQRWEIFGRFKSFHLEISEQLFGSGRTPETVLSFFAELEGKLRRAIRWITIMNTIR
jgi:aspartate kinase